MRISRVVGNMTAGNKHASISQCGVASAKKPISRGCSTSERVTHGVPDVGVQRLIIIGNKKDAAIRKQGSVNGSGGPVGNRRPLPLGRSLGVTADCECYNEQKEYDDGRR